MLIVCDLRVYHKAVDIGNRSPALRGTTHPKLWTDRNSVPPRSSAAAASLCNPLGPRLRLRLGARGFLHLGARSLRRLRPRPWPSPPPPPRPWPSPASASALAFSAASASALAFSAASASALAFSAASASALAFSAASASDSPPAVRFRRPRLPAADLGP